MSAPVVGSGPIRSLFPIPLVAAAVILVALILFTPILFEYGPAAPGTFEVQAELIVDRVGGGNSTSFYVHAVGATVRYETIAIGVASNFLWNGTCPTRGLNWSVWQNGSSTLEQSLSVASGTMAVTVSAKYTAGGGTAIYAAKLALTVSGDTLYTAVCYGVSPPSAEPVGSLPIVLLLTDWGQGGPP